MNLKIILYELAKRMKSIDDKIFISSAQFAEFLGISQRSASRYLKNLEHENLIKRKVDARSQEIELTDRGIKTLNEIYLNLRDLFENKKDKKEIVIEGEIIEGIGEGAYYIKEYCDKINEKLNFIPYEGTLNIKLNKNFIDFNFDKYVSDVIPAFERDGRTFGKVKCIPVKLSVKSKKNKKEIKKEIKKENCFVIIPERTHHKNAIEIISEFNLREKLNLKKGDNIRIELT